MPTGTPIVHESVTARCACAWSQEQEDRADAGAGREDRVLERAEAEHPHARLVARDAEILERLDVDREPAAGMNIPKPAATIAPARSALEPDAAADVRDLAVREGVADVRGHGARHRERDPVPVRVPDVRGDGARSPPHPATKIVAISESAAARIISITT